MQTIMQQNQVGLSVCRKPFSQVAVMLLPRFSKKYLCLTFVAATGKEVLSDFSMSGVIRR